MSRRALMLSQLEIALEVLWHGRSRLLVWYIMSIPALKIVTVRNCFGSVLPLAAYNCLWLYGFGISFLFSPVS